MKNRRHTGWLVVAALLVAGCSGQYAGVPGAELLNYQSRPTYGHLYDLATSYALNINEAVAADTMHPGLYADYGVALALMGHRGEACRMLNAEAKAFPQNKAFVQRIKQRLLPDMMDDTMASYHETADMGKLAGWAYDSLTALQPLPYIAPVIDSTDTARIRMQTQVDSVEYPIRLTANQKRELLAQQQMAAEMQKKAAADSVAAAKQAKIDQRNKAQADRKKAKKEQEKARKAAEKQKKKEAKEKARQREKEKQQQAAERRQQQAQKKKEGGKK